jgi:hypothetical protein
MSKSMIVTGPSTGLGFLAMRTATAGFRSLAHTRDRAERCASVAAPKDAGTTAVLCTPKSGPGCDGRNQLARIVSDFPGGTS